MKRSLSVVILLAAAAPGCRPGVESREAIRLAVIEDIKDRSGIDLTVTTVRVAKVVFIGNRAEADVAFRTNGGDPPVVDVHYSLSRVGEGWKVDARQPLAGRSARPNKNLEGVHPSLRHPGEIPSSQ